MGSRKVGLARFQECAEHHFAKAINPYIKTPAIARINPAATIPISVIIILSTDSMMACLTGTVFAISRPQC
jgi:hypothetical protein